MSQKKRNELQANAREKDSTRTSSEIIEFRESFESLKSNPEFRKFIKENPSLYLASVFTLIEDKPMEWEFCFYDRKKDRLEPFIISSSGVNRAEESEAFKEPGKKLKKIDEKALKLGLKEILSIAAGFQAEKYPAEKPVKIIVVLHQEENLIWNITYLTQTFKTLTVKILAESGEIAGSTIQPLFSPIEDEKKAG
ncbi:MAG: hypothetical protein NTV63_00710 [Candidatus Woesearchaeota archaeon]|nr:hypothetical protein [Candidatus Woesearchaeota archaeon]